MVDTWGFSFFSTKECHRGFDIPFEDYQETFDTHMANVVKVEEFGFHGWAWAEHHFHPTSNAPSPHLLVANAAARTSQLKLSVLGSVLCLHDGRRHAEEVAMLDYLTHGRFEPGIAPGAGPRETIEAGHDPELMRSKYYSAAEFLEKALAGRTVTLEDDYTKVKDLAIIPPLRPEVAKRVWVTVMSPDSAAWTATRGYKLVTGWLPTPVAAQLANHYRTAAEAAGNSTDPSMLGIRRRVFVADSDAEAQEKVEQSLDIVKFHGGKALEMADPKVAAMMMHPDDFTIGSPETVAEGLIEQCRAGGYGALMAFVDFAQFKSEDLIRSLELIGTKVAPMLKSAGVTAPVAAAA